METINIFEFEPHLQPHFERLNREWIEKYFVMEPVDVEVVTHPQQLIIDHGGTILFASLNEEVVGTVALKKVNDDEYELCKMAVNEKARGYHVGLKLGEAALKKARMMGARKVILYSQRTFNNSIAINLYYRLGFKEIALEKGGYDRCDIKMLYDFEIHDYCRDVSDRLRKLVTDYHEKFNQVPFNEWSLKTALTKWSKKQILGHLIDSASNNHQRFVRAQYTNKLISPRYMQEEWVTLQNYQHQNIEQLISLWFAYNMQLAWVIENMHYEMLKIPCIVGDENPVTLQFLVEDYISHLLHHSSQII
ncbi:MAG: GNAT family N-acetyltransferase [Chitinophagales bacterium]|nr:GNAT family N-acetyltransferase [Chitinophagales bacterium]